MQTNRDAIAKRNGFIIGISDTVYEKRISLFNYLYIEKIDKSYTVYRMDVRTNTTKLLKKDTTFNKAMEKALDYHEWFGNKN